VLQVTLAVRENGWDGNDDTDEAVQQWSFAGSLLYAITVITTIGTTTLLSIHSLMTTCGFVYWLTK